MRLSFSLTFSMYLLTCGLTGRLAGWLFEVVQTLSSVIIAVTPQTTIYRLQHYNAFLVRNRIFQKYKLCADSLHDCPYEDGGRRREGDRFVVCMLN